MIAIAYHKQYKTYDLGLNHPLIGDKPEKTMQFFEKKGILDDAEVFEPHPASERDLSHVHSLEFIQRIKSLSREGGILTSDTPVPKGAYDAAKLATGGTMLCSNKLFSDFKISLNPLAGFHHASREYSSGFCFFNDIAVAIENIRKKRRIKRVMIIDLDVHHANGTQNIYYDDPTVLNISFHQDGRTLYPGTGSIHETGEGKGRGYTVNMPFFPGSSNRSYLRAFDKLVPKLVESFSPEVIFYQSGVDTHHSDPLANMKLTFQAYYVFAKKIRKISENTCKKLLVALGGGYNSDASVKSYYNIASALLNKEDFFTEEEAHDPHFKANMKNMDKLIEVLSHYHPSLDK